MVKRSSILQLYFICSVFHHTTAQITETDTLRWGTQISASGNFAFGNVERILLSNSAEIVHSMPSKNWVFKTAHQHRYSEVNNRKLDNNYRGNGYIYFRPFKKHYPFYLALYETNFRVRIKNRFQNGVGITWVPLKNFNDLVKISSSVIYDVSKYDDGVIINNMAETTFKILRPTFRFYGEHLVKNSFKINYEFIDQISISNKGDHRLLAFIGLGYGIIPIIDLKVRLNYSHEDITAIDIKKDDWIVTYGVSFTLSK